MKKSNVISDRASFKRAAIMFPQTASQPAIRLLFLIFSSNKYPDQSSSNQSQIHLLFINNLLTFMDNIYYIASEYNWFKFIPEKSYIFLNIHILCGHDGVNQQIWVELNAGRPFYSMTISLSFERYEVPEFLVSIDALLRWRIFLVSAWHLTMNRTSAKSSSLNDTWIHWILKNG